ncbi:MAG: peptide ABC transporter substrate-binding protein [Bacillota bacterium]|nr:peptide ABC transporter substrate-binding protein [Bacillota bacterium]
MNKRKVVAALLVLGLVGSVFAGCGSKSNSSTGEANKPAVEQKLVLPEGALKTLDSVKGTDTVSFDAIQNTQETLLVYNNNKPEPGAAKTFDVSADGLTYTFHLRDGLKWSDGKALTANDFKYAWLRMLAKDTAAAYSFFLYSVVGGQDYNAGKVTADKVGITAPDDKTFVVKLANPVPYFTQIAAFPGLSPEREDNVTAQGDKYGTDATKMVYSGPFTVSEWQVGAKFILKKNPNYWNASAIKMETIELPYIKELATRYQMFTNKQLDAMGGSGEYLAPLQQGSKDGKWNQVTGFEASVFYDQFNLDAAKAQKALQSPKVRLAFSLAEDRENFVSKVLKRSKAAYGLVPPTLAAGDKIYRDALSGSEPLKAAATANPDPKALFVQGLKDLGLDTDTSKYTFKYLLQASDAQTKTWAEFMQNAWQTKLGVKIEIVPSADFSDFLTKQNNGEFDICTAGWGADYNDPKTFLDLFGVDNGNNTGKYNNAKVNSLLDQLKTETDNAKRIDIYKQLEQIEVVDDPAVVPTYYRDVQSFQAKKIHGLQLPLFGGTYSFRWTSVE